MREGPLVGVRRDRRGGRDRPGDGAVPRRQLAMYAHGITFGGHPVQAAIALKNLEIMKREQIVERVREHEDAFRTTLAQLLELPIVGDLRGKGFFYALELVSDKETRERFSDEECETLLRGSSRRDLRAGLICRADDRGDPVIQISPPLVAGQAEFDEIVGILGEVLAEAWKRSRPAFLPAGDAVVDRGSARRGGRGGGAGTAARGRARGRRRDRRRRLHGLWTALDAARSASRLSTWSCSRPSECGLGPSGRNGGFVHGYWIAPAAASRALRRRRRARGRARRASASFRGFAPSASAEADVWLREGGMLRVSAAPAQDAAVEREVEAARSSACPTRRCRSRGRSWRSASARRVFRKGVFFRDGATVQPARLVRALRRAALALASGCTSTRA